MISLVNINYVSCLFLCSLCPQLMEVGVHGVIGAAVLVHVIQVKGHVSGHVMTPDHWLTGMIVAVRALTADLVIDKIVQVCVPIQNKCHEN